LRKDELDDEIDEIKRERGPVEDEFKRLLEILDKKNGKIDGIK